MFGAKSPCLSPKSNSRNSSLVSTKRRMKTSYWGWTWRKYFHFDPRESHNEYFVTPRILKRGAEMSYRFVYISEYKYRYICSYISCIYNIIIYRNLSSFAIWLFKQFRIICNAMKNCEIIKIRFTPHPLLRYINSIFMFLNVCTFSWF